MNIINKSTAHKEKRGSNVEDTLNVFHIQVLFGEVPLVSLASVLTGFAKHGLKFVSLLLLTVYLLI